MPFYPSPSQELLIDDTAYKVAEHPSAPGMPYGQEGRQATVYQLERQDGLRALKVFKERFSTPSLVTLADKIAPYASLPGMQVCQRLVLTPSRHRTLLKKYPDLTYAVLMPWVEGATWQEVLLEKHALTPEQSLLLARSLAEVLVNLEERGIAHCDLSGPNVILTLDQEHPSVGLVDVEGIYGPGIPQPNELPAGSPGYAHKTGPHGLWDPQADRFAGAVLVAEILGWSDEAVRQLSWGENFFAPDEMQVDSERNQTLVANLRTRWGDDLANLLTQAWHSDTLGECPTLGKWLVALPDEVTIFNDVRPPITPIQEGASADIARLILDGDRAANTGKTDQALQLYQQALEVATADIAGDLRNRIESLGDMKSRETDRPCPHCGKSFPAEVQLCPYCEKGRGELVEEKIKDEIKILKRQIPVLDWVGIMMVIVILVITALLSEPETLTPKSTSRLTEEPKKAPETFRVGFVTDTGGIDDDSYNETQWNGIERAQNELGGIEAKWLDSDKATQYEPNLTEFASQGYDLVIASGFLLGGDLAKVATAYPDVMYSIFDFSYPDAFSVPEGVVGNAECIPNVMGQVFKTDQAAFLAGYLAAGMTETGILGYFGGAKIPAVTIFGVGFQAGMEYYNEVHGTEVVLLGWDNETGEGLFTGDFVDLTKGKEAAESLFDEGADIFIPVGGLIGSPGFDVARERGGYGIWFDTDGYLSLQGVQDVILTSVVKKMGNSMFAVVQAALEGNFQGCTNYVGDLANGGVGISPYHDLADTVPAELQAEIEELAQMIISGEITDTGCLSYPEHCPSGLYE